MQSLIVSPRAQSDLIEIWSFIAEDSPEAADRTIDRIMDGIDQLLVYPEAGRARPEFLSDLRCLVLGNYQVFYQIIPDAIEIFRVLHGARDIENTVRNTLS